MIIAIISTHSTQAIYLKPYSLNLIWINPKLDCQKNQLLSQNQLETLCTWAQKNPTSLVNLWLDSCLTSKPARLHTQNLIKQTNLKLKKNQIKLKDIRKLTTVQNNPEIFASQIPVYFRVDLIKIIITVESLKLKHDLCLVYTDFDIKPIVNRKLFDRKTCNLLKKNHFVLAKSNNKFGFENGFQIFTYHENLILALEQILIKNSLCQAHAFIAELESSPDLIHNPSWKAKRANFQETVFRAYPAMINYFDTLMGGYLKTAIPVKKISMPASTSQTFELLQPLI